jgi:prophage maintenance system killer protein
VFVQRELTKREPMPAWETVDLAKLESALLAPQRRMFGVEPYSDLNDKTAILLYSIAKAHAWANGNKRMAFVSTHLFLGLNGFRWNATSADSRVHVLFAAASEARCFERRGEERRCDGRFRGPVQLSFPHPVAAVTAGVLGACPARALRVLSQVQAIPGALGSPQREQVALPDSTRRANCARMVRSSAP